MKRNATDLQYYYHVVKTETGYKVKRSLFAKVTGSLFCSTRKEKAEQHISLLIIKNNTP
jgi:hypothetical protein